MPRYFVRGTTLLRSTKYNPFSCTNGGQFTDSEAKRYHSLHARGELVEEVLKRYDADENAQ